MRSETKIEYFRDFTVRRANRHAIILAGGDGTRLKAITRLVAGDDCPKQFCPIVGDETLLDKTRNRTSLRISPDNTHFSLTRKHERYFAGQLGNVHRSQLVIQPENRGTAPAILYSLMRLSKLASDATVAFFPSDHYFANDLSFMNHVDAAFRAVETDPGSIVLLGIEPDKPEASYGWIEPAKSFFGDVVKSVSRVGRFWEKPTRAFATQLMSAGCLWNSFVMVGRVAAFIGLFRQHLPELYRVFAAAMPVFGTEKEATTIRSIYSWIDDTNFSSDVLEQAADQLLVMRVGDVGWCDWGEPSRVVGTLANLGVQTPWMHAIAA